jgi:hypothetical protein
MQGTRAQRSDTGQSTMSLSTLTIYDADNNAVSLYLGTSLAEKQSGLEIKAEG